MVFNIHIFNKTLIFKASETGDVDLVKYLVSLNRIDFKANDIFNFFSILMIFL